VRRLRGIVTRIGIALLNILVPGLGFLCLGRWRIGVAVYAISLAIFLFLRFGPLAPFAVWAAVMLSAIATYLFGIFGALFLKMKRVGTPLWRRWYVITGAGVLALGVNAVLLDIDKVAYRNFYVPAESMSPTLPKGDRFVAHMRSAEWKRGDIVLVRSPNGDTYVKRLAGLPGDRIELAGGIVFLNGVAMPRKRIGSRFIDDATGTVPAAILSEQFTGEASSHWIYDLGTTVGDDFGPVRLGPDDYFVLGDHRDRSADSRFPAEEFGLEVVNRKEVLGRALFHSWGSSRPIGTPITGRK
jgi:signal peptidase I